MAQDDLTKAEKHVLLNKGTELPFTGKYTDYKAKGTFVCRQCGTPLYRSSDKFDSGCGWPSFDDEIPGTVKRIPDRDGRRTEILCNTCGAHLGHVFMNEGFTPKETRHCVNSVSIKFVPDKDEKIETAIFAGGCFWGVEYYMKQLPGVLSVESGYIGGAKDDPSYEEVCRKDTGHAEAVRIEYNPDKVSYEELAKRFFEIHDPTQLNRQGPDMGEQYRSEIFYMNEEQKAIAEKLIAQLKGKGYDVVTQLTPATHFWPAEDYHQNYYQRKGTLPYCHGYTKRF
jgi:methionine-R-sulfoxide reductase/methionine-S-sulfoxide reductase